MKKSILLYILFFFNSCDGDNHKNYTKGKLNIKFKKEWELRVNNIVFDLEIADDDYQTSMGLMYRDSLKDNQAMLFVFEKEDYRSFYMKNTRISLDIIYIDSKKVIKQIYRQAKPYNEESLPSNIKVKYVLEINGGLCDKLDIKEGDILIF